MKACPTEFSHPSEAQQLNGLGPKLCDRLTEKLKKHNAEYDLPMPEKPHKATKEKRAANADVDTDPVAPKKRKTTKYVPKLRSGAYALVLALATLDPDENRALSKAELIAIAQDNCDSSFTTGSDTTKHYTAWSSMSNLIDRELVCTKGHPTKRYYLSDEGWETALACQKIAGVVESSKNADGAKKQTQPISMRKSTKTSTGQKLQAQADDMVELSSEPDVVQSPPERRVVPPMRVQPVQSDGDTILLTPGSFDVQLVLDSREVRSKTDRDYIADELRKQGVRSFSRSLPLGDILWVAKVKPEHTERFLASNKHDDEEGNDEIVLDYIVERKRLDDLISSIKDGRFHEQKFRLRKSGVPHVTYLVEAFSISAEKSDTYGQSVETAITSTQVVNDIFVKQTNKLDETIKYLARMTRTLQDMYSTKAIRVVRSDSINTDTYLRMMDRLRKIHHNSTVGTTFSAFNALCAKNDDMTLRDVYLKMLLSARGVTADKAIEIQRIWPTPIALIEAYEACATAKDRENMLSNRLSTAIPRKKIRKALSTKIANVWVGDE